MKQQRILGYDLARALAILGMIIVNFKVVMHAQAAKEGQEPWWISIFAHLDGRASALFVILAGVGISLMTSTARLARDAVALHQHRISLLKRAAFLFGFGLLYIWIWPADILHYYGLYIALAAALLTVSSRLLLMLAAAFCLIFTALFFSFNYSQNWNWDLLHYSNFWTAPGFLLNLFFNGFHPFFPWAGYLLVGMVIGRLDMHVPVVRQRVLLAGATAMILAQVLAWALFYFLGNWELTASLRYLFSKTDPMPPLPVYMISATGSACIVIILSIYLAEKFADTLSLRALVHTGQLALSIYLAHVLIGMVALEELGYLEGQTLGMAVAAASSFFFIALICSHLWRLKFRQGPLERLLRRLSSSKN
ncbi:DUF418 domain-containing protein [Undibacterium sp. Di27W]|uniref:DUF418 domain-containing protein n=1 Tax=Undibacterium sp. Di27W TaxID=3413036 RepID=UPI003BEFD2A0